MDADSKTVRGAAPHTTDHSIAQTDIAQTAPEGNNSSGDKRESLPVDGINIKFTPESQGPFTASQLEALLHGPQGLSQLQSEDPLMQTQDCSLQQEMLRAERSSTEREQTRAQEAAAALRGEAAQQADPAAAAVLPDPQTGLVAGQAAESGMVDIKPGVGEDAAAAMAAAAAAAAAGGADAEELLKLAQAAEIQGLDPTAYAALQQQGYDWSAYANMPMMGAPGLLSAGYYWGQPYGQQSYQQRHSSLSKLEHANSNAKRRGPMDEMRQLQRILTKLLPGSVIYMPNQDGGGNKVQADDIKVYLAATLGQAPKPDWGLKNGWGQYLADLFNWATGREGDDKITREQAMSCARRPQGRSWEVVFDKLMELGIYSWNWELPLDHQQVLNCMKSPPPELTRQQEALAAATAAAAAAAAVTAGAAPDAIPNLPVVARMASLLGKRQHQQLAPMPALPMGPPPMMFAPMPMDASGMDASGMGGSVATSAAPAAGAAAAGAAALESGVEASAERANKQQRSSSADPAATEATGSAGGAPVPAPGTPGKAATAAPAAVSDAELAIPSQEVLQAASVQQLMTYIDGALSSTLQALQTKVLSGNARCPSMEYIMNMKNFKLDPLYASCIALVLQAGSSQAALEQHMAQQAALQQAKAKVKAESAAQAASSQPAGPAAAAAAAPAPAPTVASAAGAAAGAAASAGVAASSTGTGVIEDPAAAAAAPRPATSTAVTSDAQGERDSDAALAAAAAAAGAAAAMAMAQSAPKTAAAAAALKGKKPSKGRVARDPHHDLQQLALQQSAVQAAAAEAAMAAAARQQQKAIAADRLGRQTGGQAVEESHHDSEDAAVAAAAALTALAGSQDMPDGMDLDYQQPYQQAGTSRAAAAALKKGRAGSRLANGSGRSPMKAR